MKRLILISILFSTFFIYSQTASYNDIGVLFTKENINGTARFNAMSGAFGALGGDLSAIDVNPAGAAIFKNSEASFSIDFNATNTTSSYYGGDSNFINNDNNLSQAGAVFVFKDNFYSGDLEKIALAINYSRVNDFDNLWFAEGNNGYPTWVGVDENYLESNGQYLENLTKGRNDKYSITIATKLKNSYLGFSVNAYSVDYYQLALIEEDNVADNDDYILVSNYSDLATFGDGISFNFGFISKPTDNVRFGVAYQSPVWYNLEESYIEYDTQIYYSNVDQIYSEYSGIGEYSYRMRTPSKLTGSFAYIFGKTGLFSADLSMKNYKNIKLTNEDFSSENSEFDNYNQAIYELRLGTEWRFDKLSLRGGYHYEQSPYKDAIATDNIEGYSLGAGYNFGNIKIAFSYQQDLFTSPYNFYPDYSENISNVELDTKLEKFSVSLVVKL